MATQANPTRRDNIIGIAALLLAIGLFFGPILIQPDKLIWTPLTIPSDIGAQHWGDMVLYANAMREGKLILWEPVSMMGRPLAGDIGTLFLYPFVLMFAVLPTTFGFNAYYAIHFFLAALFMFLFLRIGYKVSSVAAVVAGLAYAFMPKMVAHAAIGHVGIIPALTLAPAVLLGLKMAFDGSLLAAALAGLALAIQLPTHIQEPYYIAVIASVFWLWHLVESLWGWYRGDSKMARQVKWLVGVYAVWLIAFALSGAAVIGPLLEIFPFGSRTRFTVVDANMLALPVGSLLTLVAPGNQPYGEKVIFLGAIPPLLAVFGAVKYTNTICPCGGLSSQGVKVGCGAVDCVAGGVGVLSNGSAVSGGSPSATEVYVGVGTNKGINVGEAPSPPIPLQAKTPKHKTIQVKRFIVNELTTE